MRVGEDKRQQKVECNKSVLYTCMKLSKDFFKKKNSSIVVNICDPSGGETEKWGEVGLPGACSLVSLVSEL